MDDAKDADRLDEVAERSDDTRAVAPSTGTTPQRGDVESQGQTNAAATVGAGAGAAGGATAGAAVGTVVLGPLGSVVGAVAGALGGGWAGLAAGREEARYTAEHDEAYRRRYDSSPSRLADRDFEQVRAAYQLGHLAAHNPDYRGRDFALIEPELRRAWTGELVGKHGEWDALRPWVQDAYEQGGTTVASNAAQSQVVVGDGSPENASDSPVQGATFAELNMGGTGSHQRASFADPIPPGDPERVSGDRSVPGRE